MTIRRYLLFVSASGPHIPDAVYTITGYTDSTFSSGRSIGAEHRGGALDLGCGTHCWEPVVYVDI
jgi:hypothetical protein